MEEATRARTRWMLEPFVEGAKRFGISPNWLTVIGFLLNCVAGVLISQGQIFGGGLVMTLLAMPLDALDGELARKTNQHGKFGAFFDSSLDRVADGALLMGLAAWFLQRGDTLAVYATFAALIASFMVSYTRARAEGLGVECKVGFFGRFGRFILIAAGLLLHPVHNFSITIMVWSLAILSAATAVQRMWHVYRQTLSGA
jgi:CDP-diacylglycerol--glycerol-3-phosphate 3-phosphatidyltransferase